MAFSSSVLERLRAQVTLSSVIGGYIPLKRNGREYLGLCPFHGEKTPSFTVNDAKGFFHCFGCAAHGDAITFVERYERISWREAVEKLARMAGVALPEATPAEKEREEKESRLFAALEAACRWFEQNLTLAPHHRAREYLRERGLSEETQKRFRVGYAPDARDGLKRRLTEQGFSEALLQEAGLIIRPDDGASYDRFRARLIFPIRSGSGKVIAFGGRLIASAANAPKYLNSPETPLFHKGEVLFNLDQAAPPAREKGAIIIVEGYMDAVAMAQGGFPHTVATLGTAVTEAHLAALWRIVPNPVLCLDGDAAGKRASLRAAELALPLVTPERGLRFAFLPAGEDPDSLIRKEGPAAMQACLDQAIGLAEMLWRHHASLAGKTPESKAALEATLMQLASRAGNPIIRNNYKTHFRELLWEKRKGAPAPKRASLRAPAAKAGRMQTAKAALSLFAAHPELLQEAEAEHYLAHLECGDAALEDLRQALLEAAHEDGADIPALVRAGNVSLPPQGELSGEEARTAFKRLLFAAEGAALADELRTLERQDLDEAGCARLEAVLEQMQALRSRQFGTESES